MSLDSVFCLAYDRKPVTFPPMGCTVLSDPSQVTETPFQDIMHAIASLKLEWQNASVFNPEGTLHFDTVSRYLTNLGKIEQAASTTILSSRASATMQTRLEQLFYTVMLEGFRGRLHRFAALSRDAPHDYRQNNFSLLIESLRCGVQAYLSLKQLTPIATTAWDIMQSAMTCGLLLAGLERALQTPDSQELLRRLGRSLANATDGVSEESASMMMVPYAHGLEALEWLLRDDGTVVAQ